MTVKIYGIHLVSSSEDQRFKQRDAKRRRVKKKLSKGLCTWSLECDNDIYKSNWCRTHYRRARKWRKMHEEERRLAAERWAKWDYQDRLNAIDGKPFRKLLKKLRGK